MSMTKRLTFKFFDSPKRILGWIRWPVRVFRLWRIAGNGEVFEYIGLVNGSPYYVKVNSGAKTR